MDIRCPPHTLQIFSECFYFLYILALMLTIGKCHLPLNNNFAHVIEMKFENFFSFLLTIISKDLNNEIFTMVVVISQ